MRHAYLVDGVHLEGVLVVVQLRIRWIQLYVDAYYPDPALALAPMAFNESKL
jgi:hypothetical protein